MEKRISEAFIEQKHGASGAVVEIVNYWINSINNKRLSQTVETLFSKRKRCKPLQGLTDQEGTHSSLI